MSREYPGLEVLARQVADELRPRLPPDVGAAIWLYHYGEGGGLAYVATAERVDMINVVAEWLAHVALREGYAREVSTALGRHFLMDARPRNPANG